MRIFKLIEIDLAEERGRLNTPRLYNRQQRAALLKLYELFEAGEWQKCLDFVRDKKNFPYNKKHEYPEQEHISSEVSDVLRQLAHRSFYTQDMLLKEAAEKIRKDG